MQSVGCSLTSIQLSDRFGFSPIGGTQIVRKQVRDIAETDKRHHKLDISLFSFNKRTEIEHLHRFSTIAEQQRGQISSDWISWFQWDRVFVKGMFNRPSFAQVPVRDKVFSLTSADMVHGTRHRRTDYLWKFQAKRSVRSAGLLSSSFITSCLLGGLILQTDPELPSISAVTMSS